MARVSVIIASYNHARFINDAIASILAQTMSDLELIVIDDGSRDNSNAIVAAIQDPRLRHVPLAKNIGACAAFNMALGMCTGEFVALCNSDDVWVADKLERQLAQFTARPEVGAVFSNVTWINDNGAVISENRLPAYADIFNQPNRPRAQWMRRLVEQGNCLCHPSVLIRREVYGVVGALDNLLRQLPDHDLWLRVLQSYDIYVMPDKLVLFRVHESNTSKPSPGNAQRTQRERVLVTKRFFRDVTPKNFHAAFMPADTAVPVDPVQFLRAKAAYLVQADGTLRNEMLEMAIDAIYLGSIDYGQEIVPALDFQVLTAQAKMQSVWPIVKHHLKTNVEQFAGPKVSDRMFNAITRSKNRLMKKFGS